MVTEQMRLGGVCDIGDGAEGKTHARLQSRKDEQRSSRMEPCACLASPQGSRPQPPDLAQGTPDTGLAWGPKSPSAPTAGREHSRHQR